MKLTEESHPDFKDLKEAWNAMADLATSVNDKKRQEEEATGLFDTFEQTKHCPPTLISHRRRLILSSDAICPKSNRPIKLVICSDLLMISLSVSKTVLQFPHFAQNSAPEFTHRFIRWLDLLDIKVEDITTGNNNSIRVIFNPSMHPNPQLSQSTPSHDITPTAKDLASSSILLQFGGYDATKSKNTFLKAIETVTKSCLGSSSDKQ